MKKTILIVMTLLTIFCVTACNMNKNDSLHANPKTQNQQETFIGEDAAKEAALKKAGISSEGVVFDRVELERDDGVWQYEIEFRKDRTEYDADINAVDGSVLKWEVDKD